MQSLAPKSAPKSPPSEPHRIRFVSHPYPSTSAKSLPHPSPLRGGPTPAHSIAPNPFRLEHAHPNVRPRASHQSPTLPPAPQTPAKAPKSIPVVPPPPYSPSLCPRPLPPLPAHRPTFESLRPPSTESPAVPPLAESSPKMSASGRATQQYPTPPIRLRPPRYIAPPTPPDPPRRAILRNSRLSPRARRPHRGRE